jgi:hypothetical protein
MRHTSARELWHALDRKYAESDAGRELYVNDQCHEYKMVDDRSIMEQAHEIQLLVRELAHFDCVLPDKFMVGGIIAKLPPYWKYFSTSLKHKETMTVESLIASLDIEENARSKDVPHSVPQEGISNANMVEGKSGGGNKNTKNWKGKAKHDINFKKKRNKEDLTCFVCGEPDHIARKCRQRKGKKGVQRTTNVVVSEAGGSGYEPKILLACQSIDWWLDTGANIHVCSDLNLFSTYQVANGCSILMGNGSRAAI